MEHHKVFYNFKCYNGKCDPLFVVNFLGAFTRKEYLPHFSVDRLVPFDSKEKIVHTEYPEYSKEYFIWIITLESIIEAKGGFTMFKLGAGYGAKLIDACIAVRRYHGKHFPCNLVGVEAEPTHFKWMQQNCIDNNIDPASQRLINAAISEEDGSIYFTIDFPSYYGQNLVRRASNFHDIIKRILLFLIPFLRTRKILVTDYWTGKNATGVLTEKKVKAVSLSTLLSSFDRVDLICSDIQGAENIVFKSAKKEIHTKVKKIYIGTHSSQIEDELRALFNNLGWKCLYDYPGGRKCATPYGVINFQDGVQVWLNQEMKL